MRRDILSPKNRGITQPPPAKHQFSVLMFLRLLTQDNPAGKPSLEQVRITGTRDVIKMEPEEMLLLEDETGAQIPHRVKYGQNCVTGQDLIENTSPDRLLTLAVPATPTVSHEPGLPMRLGLEIQALNALDLSLDDESKTIPANFEEGCHDEAARLEKWLDLIDHLEKRFYVGK